MCSRTPAKVISPHPAACAPGAPQRTQPSPVQRSSAARVVARPERKVLGVAPSISEAPPPTPRSASALQQMFGVLQIMNRRYAAQQAEIQRLQKVVREIKPTEELDDIAPELKASDEVLLDELMQQLKARCDAIRVAQWVEASNNDAHAY